MFYHELVPGSAFVGSGRTLTDADLSIACMISGDWHPIHADETYAKQHGLAGRLFQGSFGIFLATGMATTLPHFSDEIVGALGIREWTYRAPIFVGDTVHVRAVILNKRLTSDDRPLAVGVDDVGLHLNAAVVQEGIAGTMMRLSSA